VKVGQPKCYPGPAQKATNEEQGVPKAIALLKAFPMQWAARLPSPTHFTRLMYTERVNVHEERDETTSELPSEAFPLIQQRETFRWPGMKAFRLSPAYEDSSRF
jgi:hypothetical protein